MHDKISGFIRILLVELDDLEHDIKDLMTEYEAKHNSDVITNYVFFENLALSQRELFGIDGFLSDIKSINPPDITSIDQLVENLSRLLHERVSLNGLPKAIELMVGRKIEKVKTYINQ